MEIFNDGNLFARILLTLATIGYGGAPRNDGG